ncbi:uncharacterized protein TRIADDRAFT_58752 [Trichoplax adhaerens]|uniref:AAA+ ATPase domain-containing protein n=1 Tax=Trichoplax adhaerens TaxID=10228 RepID=B3S3K1_TRIAD|nr:hypothetical protein TRIADDRAFT_58752 [Trichoplax adhaerens]EDV22810.1 hypothetical protein TRIADDRAFT_58752 [Trichoplax adhaerens]|eukprot:XP_002114676.1 hypothetical protein TRIADDRAFT_58752 [Trichoplax adhaerens]
MSGILFGGLNICIKMVLDSTVCLSHECCTDRARYHYLTNTMIESLRRDIFGQELAVQTMGNIFKRYQMSQNSFKNNKIFLFHGDIGTGKSYAASLLAHHLFPLGIHSRLVMNFDLVNILDDKNNDIFQANQWLTNQILKLSRLCYAGVIILERWDEVNLCQFNVIDSIVGNRIGDPNQMKFRRMTFIFISTMGSAEINNATIAAYSNNLLRGDFQDRQIYHQIAALITDKVPQFASIDSLINIIVPFLPLQRIHIKQCALHAISTTTEVLVNQDRKAQLAEHIANSVSYHTISKFQFAKWGCKRVYDILNAALSVE